MNSIKVFTIGVYGYQEEEFFQQLLKHKIDVFVDIPIVTPEELMGRDTP